MRDTVPDRKKHDLHIRLATNRVQTGLILGTFFGSVRSGRDTVPWGGRSVGAVLKGFEDFFDQCSSPVRGHSHVEIVFFPVRIGIAHCSSLLKSQ